MFETAETGQKLAKATFAQKLPELREGLLAAQYALLTNRAFPVVLIVDGVDGAGKGDTVNLLTEWMDPRHIRAHAMAAPNDEERARPPMWRFWRRLPPKGQTGIFLGSWYSDPLASRVRGELSREGFEIALAEIAAFERMLVLEGALLVKFWFHLSKDKQEERLRSLEGDPLTRWRVTPSDWEDHRLYDKYRRASSVLVRETSTGEAPWVVLDAADARYRSYTVGKTLLDSLRKRLGCVGAPCEEPKGLVPLPPVDRRILGLLETPERDSRPKAPANGSSRAVSGGEDSRTSARASRQGANGTRSRRKQSDGSAEPGLAADEHLVLDKETYERKLEKLSGKLATLSRRPKFQKRAVVCVFEGMDAAGKGGAIRRVTGALDARFYDVVPVAAPTEEERAQPYLWRFWRHVPPARGRVVIFDRSWYGRVLVERVEKFAREDEWRRAYREINDFEAALSRGKIVVAKFWLQISKDEQLRRFQEREHTPWKRFKITDEDWRNRDKWDDYVAAACEMIDRTSTDVAPWTVVSTNDKMTARLQVMRALNEAIERAL